MVVRWRPCRWFPWLCCLFLQPALKSWGLANVPSLLYRLTLMPPGWIPSFLKVLYTSCRSCVAKKSTYRGFFCLQYVGKWYEIQKLPTAFQKGECGTATYSLKAPGVVGVLNRELLWVHVIRFKIPAASLTHTLYVVNMCVEYCLQKSLPHDRTASSTNLFTVSNRNEKFKMHSIFKQIKHSAK